MITPTKLDNISDGVVSLIDKLQEDIIKDICRRITKSKYLTPTAEWQIYKANQLSLSYNEVNKKIAQRLNKTEQAIEDLYTDTVKDALEEDLDIFRIASAQGMLSNPNIDETINNWFRSPAFSRLLAKGLNNAKGSIQSLCRSMASQANKELSDAMDMAHLKILSGAFSYNDAIYTAVMALSDKGITKVSYPSGRTDNIDVCVRRAVLSSINKSCCDLQLDLAREVGSKYVEVSAHMGARPSHAEWQGQIYCLYKGDAKYPYFYDSTGYGSGDGLGGWNCRHNFFPYFEGVDTPYHISNFSVNENNEYYALTQKQRSYERQVRDYRRRLAAVDSARKSADVDNDELKNKLDYDFARYSVTLKNHEKQLENFVKANNLISDATRIRTAGFGRSASKKSTSVYKKALTLGNGNVIIGLKAINLKNALSKGLVNTKIDKSKQNNHVVGKYWKNQVKQALQSTNGSLKPKSLLSASIDAQDIIDKYAGKGDAYKLSSGKYPDEFVTLPFIVGKTFNSKTGKYENTHRVQIKYDDKKGTHVFPVIEGS